MDDPRLEETAHRDALAGLERLNRASGVARRLWRRIEATARRHAGPVEVLDVACGAGDTAIALARRARAAGLPVRVSGCDVHPTALAHARRRAQAAGVNVTFFETDVLRAPPRPRFDVICCSLFLHHLDDDQVIALLAGLRRAARRMVVVTDLRRSALGYVLAWAGARVLTRSRVCHVDAPRSVRAAFSGPELARLAARAGMGDGRLRRQWPQRFYLTWTRP